MDFGKLAYKLSFTVSTIKTRLFHKITNIRHFHIPEPIVTVYRTFNFELIVLVYIIFVGGLPAHFLSNGNLIPGIAVAIIGHLFGRVMLEERQRHKKEEWKQEVLDEFQRRRGW